MPDAADVISTHCKPWQCHQVAHPGTHVRLAVLSLLTSCGDACDPAPADGPPDSAATSSSAPARVRQYPRPSWSTIRDDTKRAEAQQGVTAITRTLLGKVTEVDPIAVSLQLEPPAQVTNVVLVWGDSEHASTREEHGVYHFAPVSEMGRHEIHLKGEASRDGKSLGFTSAHHSIEVVEVGRTALPVGDLRGIASRFVAKVEALDAPPVAWPGIEDTTHNVVFRFDVGDELVHIAMSRRGGLLGGQRVPKSGGEGRSTMFDRAVR